MEAELATLATTGATALVTLMVTEGWTQAKERIVRFFARGESGGHPDEDVIDAELEGSREDLAVAHASADERAAADVEAEWRARLRRTLRADPAAADQLRALLAELEPSTGTAGTDRSGDVHNNVSGGVQHAPVIMGRDISLSGNDLRGFGGPGGTGTG